MRQGAFIAIVLAIALGGYAVLLGIGASPLYCRHSTSFFDTAPCYKLGVAGQTAETLLVGDSSLLYGVRPDLVAAAGGGATYNLGMVGPSFGYDPALLIDAYLAKNARPSAIILYFAPWHAITHDRLVDPQWFPLALTLLQHGDVRQLSHFLVLRPSAIVETPPTLLNGIGPGTQDATERRAAMTAQGGYLDYAARGLPPLAGCRPGSLPRPAYPIAADNAAAIAALKARYRARGIAVFAYVAPWAICDGHEAEIAAAYRGVADARPEALPDALFADDSRQANHVHASAAGVEAFSGRIANFIRTVVRPRMAAAR